MLADTMIPEAFEKAHVLTGLITAVGFLTALAVHSQVNETPLSPSGLTNRPAAYRHHEQSQLHILCSDAETDDG